MGEKLEIKVRTIRKGYKHDTQVLGNTLEELSVLNLSLTGFGLKY